MFRLMRIEPPPQGWKAVAWELVIVTLGVLIALAAQQWAEERSWSAKVAQSRLAIREELQKHYLFATEWRVVQPCIDAQLERLRQRVEGSGARLDPAPAYRDEALARFVVRLPAKDYVEGTWQAAIADGVAPRLEPKTRSLLIDHFAALDELESNTAQTTQLERSLVPLSRPIELTSDIRFTLLDRLEALQTLSNFIDLQAGQVLYVVEQLGMKPDPATVRQFTERYGTYQFCRANRLPMRSFAAAMVAIPN